MSLFWLADADRKNAPDPELARYFNPPTVRFDDRFADGQAEPGASSGAGARFVGAEEAFEDVRKICWSDAGVGYDEYGGAMPRANMGELMAGKFLNSNLICL